MLAHVVKCFEWSVRLKKHYINEVHLPLCCEHEREKLAKKWRNGCFTMFQTKELATISFVYNLFTARDVHNKGERRHKDNFVSTKGRLAEVWSSLAHTSKKMLYRSSPVIQSPMDSLLLLHTPPSR